jgi:hypothetical protein
MRKRLSEFLACFVDIWAVVPGGQFAALFAFLGAVFMKSEDVKVHGRLFRFRWLRILTAVIIVAIASASVLKWRQIKPDRHPLAPLPRSHILPDSVVNDCGVDFQHRERNGDDGFAFVGGGPCHIAMPLGTKPAAVAFGVQHKLFPKIPIVEAGMDLRTQTGTKSRLRFRFRPSEDGLSFGPEAYHEDAAGKRFLTSRLLASQLDDTYTFVSRPDAVKIQYQFDGITFLVGVTFLALNNRHSRAPIGPDRTPIRETLFSDDVPQIELAGVDAAIGSMAGQPRFDIFVAGYWWGEPIYFPSR